MRFAFTDEQEELRRTVRRMLDDRAGRRPAAPDEPEPVHDPVLWKQLAEQLGAHALAVPESYGGAGFSLLETSLVVEELGRALAAVPFLGSAVIAAQALLGTGDDFACERILPGVADGSTVAALAWAERDGRWDPARCASTARRDGDRWVVDGEKRFVLDGSLADTVLVVARAPGGMSLFELTGSETPTRAEATMDRTRALATLSLDATPARLIGAEGEAEPALRHVLDVACAALAAEQVGASARCLTDTVEYVKMRTQFGRPIGSFQAVKHRLADRYVELESARSAAYAASWAVATGSERAGEWAAAAKSFCSEAYREIAAEGIQLHGGIAVTWEHPAHRHLKRAHSAEQLFGTPRQHRSRLERALGLV